MKEEVADTIVGANNIAKVIGRSVPTLMNIIKLEDFPAYLVGGIWEVNRDDMDAWIDCKRKGIPYNRGNSAGHVKVQRDLDEVENTRRKGK